MISTFLTLALALATLPQDLDDRLEDALADLHNRDEAMAEEVEHALEHDPERALEFLEEHADYLDTLRDAPPRLRSVMMQQEALQLEVHDAVERVHEAEEVLEELRDRDQQEGIDQANERLEEADRFLKACIDRWFEMRMRMRLVEIELAEEELVELEGFLDRLRDGEAEDEARELWLERALAGGPREMQRRIDEWQENDRWHALVDTLIELFEEGSDRAHGEGPSFEELIEWAEGAERPEVLERAYEEVGPYFHLENQFVELQELLLSAFEDGQATAEDDEVVIPGELLSEAEALIEDLTRIELDAGVEELEFLREDIREERRTLEQRRGHKELMLTLKHAELLGYRHLFDW